MDPLALSYADYVANRTYLKSKGVAAGNVTRTIISQQLYAFSQNQALALMDELEALGITSLGGMKVTIEALKGGLGKLALSEINDALKASGMMSGYERSDWITEHIYADSI